MTCPWNGMPTMGGALHLARLHDQGRPEAKRLQFCGYGTIFPLSKIKVENYKKLNLRPLDRGHLKNIIIKRYCTNVLVTRKWPLFWGWELNKKYRIMQRSMKKR